LLPARSAPRRRPPARPHTGARRAHPWWRVLIGWLALSALACGERDTRRGVLVAIELPEERPRPEQLLFTWSRDGQVLWRDRVLPETGTLPTEGSPLYTVFIESDAEAVHTWEAVVRGVRGQGEIVGEGRGEVQGRPADRPVLVVTLGGPGSLPGDGGAPDGGDGGPRETVDASVRDGSAPQPGLDAAPADGSVPADAGAPVDAPTDAPAPPPDVAAPDVAPDGTPAPDAGTTPALFVVGTLPLVPADQALDARLRQLGYLPTAVRESAVTEADTRGKAVLVISSSIAASNLRVSFRDVAVPIVCFDAYYHDDLGLTGARMGVDYGPAPDQTTVQIVAPTHPLAAGLSGRVITVAMPEAFGWGLPGPGATRIATIVDKPDQVAIFGIATGAPLVGTTRVAPARRVALWGNHFETTSFTSEGLALFEAAVRWAAGR
jgi:hypothetical protein